MFDMKPELISGESVLGEYGATVYMVRGTLSSSGSNIRLFLTNQRLILKAGLGPQRTLPLYAIRDIREEKIGFYSMVRIEFSNGHLEWMTVQNQPQFIEALKAAKMQAPEIPDVVPQANADPAAKKGVGTLVIVIIVIAACLLVGICLLAISLGGGWFFLRTH
jgi:hypothetical protein